LRSTLSVSRLAISSPKRVGCLPMMGFAFITFTVWLEAHEGIATKKRARSVSRPSLPSARGRSQ
jgi:hypothetical protein